METPAAPRLLGWPPDGPTLRLDYRRYAYAGKFVVSSTGKAVIAPEGWEPVAEETRGVGAAEGADAAEEVDAAEEATGTRGNRVDGASMEDGLLAAASFDEDRTDPGTLRLRYVTVRDDRRGEGHGPRLCAFVCTRAADRGYERVRIAVNNPYAFEALSRAGFAFTGEETGLAELVLERPAERVAPRDADRYRAGLDAFADRGDLTDGERAFLRERRGRGPPDRTAAE
ncbi:GNAT family N-acetyltransferase [Halorarum salinum]|uniref:GNAT family N-acetyltransferase n=1 Tax=Halorarum salinum TaxID=2743089 RepID=A0A7D5QH57_9EURY|nr:GNAT family N-acetyltransferase [Halobaculum salinum]QLG62522.1 GNAT family N-acetyltransferase [Halobaculum salinum]